MVSSHVLTKRIKSINREIARHVFVNLPIFKDEAHFLFNIKYASTQYSYLSLRTDFSRTRRRRRPFLTLLKAAKTWPDFTASLLWLAVIQHPLNQMSWIHFPNLQLPMYWNKIKMIEINVALKLLKVLQFTKLPCFYFGR